MARPSISDIQARVSAHYDVTRGMLASDRRLAALALPRHVAMYLARELSKKSRPAIGRMFGGRHHTTVLHACRKIEALRRDSRAFDDEVNMLIASLSTPFPQGDCLVANAETGA